MKYDPIHDTCTPAAGTKSVPSAQSESDLRNRGLRYNTHTRDRLTDPVPATLQTDVHPLAQASAKERPQSNLHRILDSPGYIPQTGSLLSNRPDSIVSQNKFAPLAVTEPNVSAAVHGVDGKLFHNFSDKNRNAVIAEPFATTDQWSPKNDTSSSARKGYIEASRQERMRVDLEGSMKDKKLSIDNLVANDPCGDRDRSVSKTVAKHSNFAPKNEELSEMSDQSAQSEETESPMPAEKLLPGMLPSGFRGFSKGSKHLKKADGEPFWRKDIQHDFLEELFNNPMRVFTNPFSSSKIENAANDPKLTFSQLYIRTLSESPKSSRILSERLMKDPEVGISVSKVCLLVNTGRMNTTINFVPDMRSALRTFHSIPSLQTTSHGPSKPLQDTPRLKTILKAVCDDAGEYHTLLDVLKQPKQSKPNTNIIKLIFLMSSFFQNVPFHYDYSTIHHVGNQSKNIGTSHGPQNNFMEFFLNDEIHPKSRARRFLWLMYTYLETSFSEADLYDNPFNPMIIPPAEYIAPGDTDLFDQDSELEVEYAEKMYHTRMACLNEELLDFEPRKENEAKRQRHDTKEVSLEKAHRRGQRLTKDDDPEDLMSIDESLPLDDGGVEEGAGHFEESFKKSSSPDRPPRKKFASSISIHLPDPNKAISSNRKWSNPSFSSSCIKKYRKNFNPCTRRLKVSPLGRDSPLSNSQKRLKSRQARGIVSHISRAVPQYDTRRRDTTFWIYDYFQSKKNSGNGLLGMEWEDLRYDLVNGIEAYSYQKLGKDFITKFYAEQTTAERHDSGDPESIRMESFMTSSDQLPGDSAPVDIGDINSVGSAFAPSHDYDSANERTSHEYSITQVMRDLANSHLSYLSSNLEKVSFDLDAETMNFEK